MKRKIGSAAITLAVAFCSTASHAAEINHVRIDEIRTGAKEDVICNFHPIDHIATPDNGTDLWFVESKTMRLGRIDLRTGAITKFDLPPVTPVDYTNDSLDALPGDDRRHGPCELVLDGDGKLWFNYQAANSIGYILTKEPHTIKLVKMPVEKSLPMAMQMGGDGKIYVQLTAVDKFLSIDPKTEKIEVFSLPEKHAGIIGGAADRSGKAHWFILMNSNKLVRFDYKTKKMDFVQIPNAKAAPFVIRSYDDGLWFTMFGASALGHYDPTTKEFTEVPFSTPDSQPVGVVIGKDGFLYSDLANADKIARIDRSTRSVVAEYPMITPKTWPDEIKQGPDGAIWVPQYLGGKATRLWLDSFGKDPGFPLNAK